MPQLAQRDVVGVEQVSGLEFPLLSRVHDVRSGLHKLPRLGYRHLTKFPVIQRFRFCFA